MARPFPPPLRPAALLLTGGASRRMGRDKATLVISGQQLADRTAALLLSVADPVLEVGPGYTCLERIQEEPPGEGPLAAVAAGSRFLPAGRPALVVATDLPRLTHRFLQLLSGYPVPTPDHCVIPHDGAGRAQPLCARYSPSALALARELVAAGHRSMQDLLQRVPIIAAARDGDSDNALRDVDTPDDLAALHRDAPGRDGANQVGQP